MAEIQKLDCGVDERGLMKYDVILADPPWKFEVWDRDTGSGRSAESHYPTMAIQDICDLQIGNIAEDNAALFLWVVWPSLREAFDVVETWGFIYKTVAWTWVKANRGGFGHFMGMGYYTRANTEPCLLAVKGNMPVQAHDVLALIYSPVREHSRKPDEQYAKIERLYPDRNYLELFAREKREGWHCWGNEVLSDIQIGAVT
jgi:N6-adenosine-specific RNA methylase IME4